MSGEVHDVRQKPEAHPSLRKRRGGAVLQGCLLETQGEDQSGRRNGKALHLPLPLSFFLQGLFSAGRCSRKGVQAFLGKQVTEGVSTRGGPGPSQSWEPLALPASVSQLVTSKAAVADSPSTRCPPAHTETHTLLRLCSSTPVPGQNGHTSLAKTRLASSLHDLLGAVTVPPGLPTWGSRPQSQCCAQGL